MDSAAAPAKLRRMSNHDLETLSSRELGAREWFVCALLLVGAGAAFLVDQSVTDWATDPALHEAIDKPFGALSGLLVFLVPMAILANQRNGGRLNIGFTAAMLLSTAITHFLKWAFGRARPEKDLGIIHFRFLEGDDGPFQAFPSGHTTAAVCLALLLGIYFPKARWVFYLWAVVVAFGRIYVDKHWLSDTLAGAAIALLSVLICYRTLGPAFYRRELPPEPTNAEASSREATGSASG